MTESTDPASIAREVRKLALPAILHSLLQTLVFVVDRIMLGRHSAAALAAMQIAGPLEWSVWSIFSAFSVGTIALVGRYVGAKDPDRARRAILVSMGVAVVSGTVVALSGLLLPWGLGLVYGAAEPSDVAGALGYLSYTFTASPVIFLGIAAISGLQGSGDTRTPLFIGVVANLVHIGLNRLFILGGLSIAPMGAAGAGLSTALSFGLETVLAILALMRVGRPVSLRLRQGASRALAWSSEYAALAKVAVPAVLERSLYHAGFLGYVAMVGQLGESVMAANQVLVSIESVCFLSADGFGIAAASLAAQSLGRRRPADAERATRVAVRDAVLLLSLCGVAFFVFRGPITRAFTDDPAIIVLGMATMPVVALAQPFMATSIVTADALRGAGETRAVLAVSALSAFGVRLVATWFFVWKMDLGLIGVWLGSTTDWFVRSILLVRVGKARALALGRASAGGT